MIRPATREDFRRFYGKEPDRTVRAWVYDDGEILGFGGYWIMNDTAVLFTDVSPNITKRQIYKGARHVVDRVKSTGLNVVAFSGNEGTTGLKHFGFVHDGRVWRLA